MKKVISCQSDRHENSKIEIRTSTAQSSRSSHEFNGICNKKILASAIEVLTSVKFLIIALAYASYFSSSAIFLMVVLDFARGEFSSNRLVWFWFYTHNATTKIRTLVSPRMSLFLPENMLSTNSSPVFKAFLHSPAQNLFYCMGKLGLFPLPSDCKGTKTVINFLRVHRRSLFHWGKN